MKIVLLILLSGTALAGALYFAWNKGREASADANFVLLGRRMELLDRRITALDQRLADGDQLGQSANTALRPASRPPINPPVLTEEQIKAAPPGDAELTAAVQKALQADPAVREALNYYAFSTRWMNANQQTVESFKSWCRAGSESEQILREGIRSRISMAINAAIWSAAEKDPATAEMMRGLRVERTRASRTTYEPERTGKLENAEKYVDYSTSPPTIDMHGLGLEMGANMKLTKAESQVPVPQEAIDDEWTHGRAVLLYAASERILQAHAPEMLAAAAQHAGEIPVLLARLAAKP